MPSERYKISQNVNDSKNTRMNLDASAKNMDYRKDEFMHLGRYFKACQTMIDMSKELGRPVKVLDLGCGEIFIPRVLYKSFLVKKSDVLGKYIGIDIDDVMLNRIKNDYETMMKTMNVKVICQDLTANCHFKVDDGYFDIVCWYENIEHVKSQFIEPIMAEVARVLSPEGVLLCSTPNSLGSNDKLPKDHVYEWSYDDLLGLMSKYFNTVDTYGVGLNVSKMPAKYLEKNKKLFDRIQQVFGRNTAFSCVAAAPLFPAKYCKNVLYIARR